jgi:hypothetical protein
MSSAMASTLGQGSDEFEHRGRKRQVFSADATTLFQKPINSDQFFQNRSLILAAQGSEGRGNSADNLDLRKF